MLGRGAAAGVAAIALAVGIGPVTGSPAGAAVLSAAARAGAGPQTATYYVTRGMGNCSYPSPPADGLYVALSPPEYAKAARCGGYLEVSGPEGSVRVKVIDQCPGCAVGHIDLGETAFAGLAPLSAGLIHVTYTYLADPPLPGPLSLEVNHGSSRYWLALLADNTGNPLASVQVRTSSRWLSLTRASYNYWIVSGAGPGPFTVRLTDTQGHQVTVHGITLRPGAVQTTGSWMYGPPERALVRQHVAHGEVNATYRSAGAPVALGPACRCAGQERGWQSGSVTPRTAPKSRSALCLTFPRPPPR
jgi:hypothetical protein